MLTPAPLKPCQNTDTSISTSKKKEHRLAWKQSRFSTPLVPKPSPSRCLHDRSRAPSRSLEQLPVGPVVIRLAVVHGHDPHRGPSMRGSSRTRWTPPRRACTRR